MLPLLAIGVAWMRSGFAGPQTRADGTDCFELPDRLSMKVSEKQIAIEWPGDSGGEFQGAVCAHSGAGGGQDSADGRKPLRTRAASYERPGSIPFRRGSAIPTIRAQNSSSEANVRKRPSNFTIAPAKRCSVGGATFTKTSP